jgi:large subunit ribosomal protein L11
MTPGPAIAQQLGPMGINMGKVISEVNTATQEFKGITVPVHLDVDPKTKEFIIKVLSPPTSELLKKELGIEKASGERKKLNVGNLAIEQVIAISKTKHASMLSNTFPSTLKSVIGTCMALGILIESKDPKEVSEEIEKGKYKTEIESQKTEVSPDKKKKLDNFFKELSAEQEEAIKKEEEEAAAAEEAKKAEAGEVAEGEEGAEAPAEGEEGAEAPAEGEESTEKPGEEKPKEKSE